MEAASAFANHLARGGRLARASARFWMSMHCALKFNEWQYLLGILVLSVSAEPLSYH
jgi:hypothetical protein